MAFIKDGKLIRRCRVCSITSDLIGFLVQKNSKNGKYYTHNICIPCQRDYNFKFKYKNVSKKEHCRRAQEWNVVNRERYNARRRKAWVLKGISKYGRKDNADLYVIKS